jgi:hypothetical protein
MRATTYSPTHFRCSTIGPAELNLRRFAGVSEAGARSRSPERSLRRISIAPSPIKKYEGAHQAQPCEHEP